jgi:hypothetical protein
MITFQPFDLGWKVLKFLIPSLTVLKFFGDRGPSHPSIIGVRKIIPDLMLHKLPTGSQTLLCVRHLAKRELDEKMGARFIRDKIILYETKNA